STSFATSALWRLILYCRPQQFRRLIRVIQLLWTGSDCWLKFGASARLGSKASELVLEDALVVGYAWFDHV
ncbi:MAG: hypothetical protein QGI25_15060, partial [Arenicellales bacterium]|nr:hypothetical protein [Arenicellales bacterium]